MTNINAYYPLRLKGWALGVNAGGGNLGVPVVQLVGLLVLATLGATHPRAMVAIYIPLIVLAALGAYLTMDNLTQNSNAKGAIREVTRHRETWVISLLYIGTFGSFIGFGFAFGQVLLVQFPEQFPVPVKAAALTFLGPLLGSLIRPARRGAGRPVHGLGRHVLELRGHGGRGRRRAGWPRRRTRCRCSSSASSMLFLFSGLGNGSVYKMIPAIFTAKALLSTERAGEDGGAAARLATKRSGALIGLAGAIGAFGGVLVNLAFRQSFLTLGNGGRRLPRLHRLLRPLLRRHLGGLPASAGEPPEPRLSPASPSPPSPSPTVP